MDSAERPTETATSTQFLSLHALRGAAAAVVLVHHCVSFGRERVTTDSSTLHLLANIFYLSGHPAVTVFFVLSGFVLFSSFSRNRTTKYKSFMRTRVWRIYPAVVASLLLTLLVFHICVDRDDQLGGYLQQGYAGGGWGNALTSATLIFSGSNPTNPVLWSLVHEMRFSVLFLPMAWLCYGHPGKFALSTAACALVSSGLIRILGQAGSVYLGSDPVSNIVSTLYFLPCFGIGMLVVVLRLRDRQGRRIGESMPAALSGAIIVVALAMMFVVNEQIGSIGAAVIIFLLSGANIGILEQLSRTRAVRFMGDISYSLYVLHFPILFMTAYFLKDASPRDVVLGLIGAAIVSIIVAAFSYELIERRFMVKRERRHSDERSAFGHP